MPTFLGNAKPTHLAIIDLRNVGFAGGFVKELPAIDRAKLWLHEGPWPNRRIIGEFATTQEAQAAVDAYITRHPWGLRLWNLHKKRLRAKSRERRRKAGTLLNQ
jgi:hypothetical protein